MSDALWLEMEETLFLGCLGKVFDIPITPAWGRRTASGRPDGHLTDQKFTLF